MIRGIDPRSDPDAPLAGLRVVELSGRVAGAYCGKLLVDAGAAVVKVEQADGDPLRRWSASGASLDGDGPLFRYLTTGKVAHTGDPNDLLAAADVVVLAATPGGAARLGVGVDAVRAANPAAVLVTISDFGWTGPWAERPATEFTLQGWCGATGFRGVPERPPVSVGGGVGEYLGGVCAAAGALAARRWATATGVGDYVDVSLLECMTLAMQAFEWLHVRLMDLPSFARSIEVPSIEPAKDGWVGTSMVTGQQWLDFASMVGQPKLAEDNELRYQLGRWPRRHEVYELIHPWFAERTVQEIVETASLFRIPMAPLGDGASIPDMDHFVERGVFRRNPAGFRQPRPPWRLSPRSAAGPRAHQQTPAQPDRTPAPLERALPLGGIRIVDLTAFWAGPSATHFLAALGADVVKVESIQRPDGIRFAAGPPDGTERWWEYSWLFHGVNVGKRSITLDLGRPEGVDLAKRLVAGADAVIENFSPRVMEAFSLGDDVLAEVNPRAVVVRMPAFGLDGPWRDRVGFAPTMEQLSGMAWLTGYPDGAPMAPRGACDPLAGIHAAFALVAALARRDRTGEGALLEVPMIEVALNVAAEQVIEHEVHGAVLERAGNRGPGAAPQNVYACRGEEQWVALAVAGDEQWAGLRRALGDPAWAADPSLATDRGRRAAHDLLDRELSAWLAGRDRDDVVEQLAAAGVPAAAVVLPPDVVGNVQLRARGFFETLDHPHTGPTEYAGLPFAPLRGVDGWCRRPAPTLGQHNDEVLGGELGLSAEELERLRESQVIGDRPVGL
jgi:crotonobetainyl-CoA:carnitine CoA-transferase CaiB-like acyl-CoA transferase